MTWFLAKGLLGFSRWAWILVVAGLIGAAIVWLDRVEWADDKRNQELGATVEREATTRTVLERTEQGNEVRENVRRDRNAAYDECVRSARTPANCVGLLSEQ